MFFIQEQNNIARNTNLNVKRIKFILGLGVLGLATALVLQYESIAKLRAEDNVLRSQIAQWTQEQATVESTTNSGSANELSSEQQSELLKLRDEATQLRGRTNELAALQQQNETLRSSIRTASAAAQPVERKKKTAEDALPQDIHPKDSWGFRGYGSPDAAVESMLYSATHGDTAGFVAGFSPEMQEEFTKHFADKDFAEEVKKNPIEEFRVLDRQTVSDDEMVLTIYTAHSDNGNSKSDSEDTHFKKIDGQWKVFEPAK